MNTPATDGWRFLWGVGIGAALGLVYGFLRPLRKSHPHLADLLFVPFLGYGWLYLSFAVCRGDIRIGYHLGIPVGMVLWRYTLGWITQPVFDLFWGSIIRFCGYIWKKFKKIMKKIKFFCIFLFSRWKKWFTIIWTIRPLKKKSNGGVPRGENK